MRVIVSLIAVVCMAGTIALGFLAAPVCIGLNFSRFGDLWGAVDYCSRYQIGGFQVNYILGILAAGWIIFGLMSSGSKPE